MTCRIAWTLRRLLVPVAALGGTFLASACLPIADRANPQDPGSAFWLGRVSEPVFSVPAGTYTIDQCVALTCQTEGATILYTTDGTAPGAESTQYSAPIAVDGFADSVTISAIATRQGLLDSSAVSQTYTVEYVWTRATQNAGFIGGNGGRAIEFQDQLWYMFAGGALHNVWTSTDGVSWTQQTDPPWPGRSYAGLVVLGATMLVCGGYNYWDPDIYLNDVWTTTDGVGWTEATPAAPWSGRWMFGQAAFGERCWVLGGATATGNRQDVWRAASDGSWESPTGTAPWSPRHSLQTAVLGDRLWVIGGMGDSNACYSDLWWTVDGSSWTMAADSAPWAGRYDFTVAVYKGRLFLIGGRSQSDDAPLNDMWFTEDGTSWMQVVAAAPWDGRSEACAVAWRGKLWMLGGYVSTGSVSDVWSWGG